jgi:hypothetical protein
VHTIVLKGKGMGWGPEGSRTVASRTSLKETPEGLKPIGDSEAEPFTTDYHFY